MLYQILVWIACISLIVLSFIFFKKLPRKLVRSITSSLVLSMSTILLTNLLHSSIVDFGSKVDSIIFTAVAVTCCFILCFCVHYLIKNEETQRKILFSVAIAIFGAALFESFRDILNGTSGFSAHYCRQISYAFPTIYFSKYLRKWLLPYFTYAAILGAFFTLFVPGNILENATVSWSDFDSVLVHSLMLIAGFMLLADKQVQPKFNDTWQFVLFMLMNLAIAHFYNWRRFVQTGDWGNGMYLTEPAMEGLHTLVFGGICILLTIVIVCAFNTKAIGAFFKNLKNKKDTPPPPSKTLENNDK